MNKNFLSKIPEEFREEFKKNIGRLAGLVFHLLKESDYHNFLVFDFKYEEEETEQMQVIFQINDRKTPAQLYSEQLGEALNKQGDLIEKWEAKRKALFNSTEIKLIDEFLSDLQGE